MGDDQLPIRIRPLELTQQPVAALDSGIERGLRGVQADVTLAAPDISGAEGGASYSAVIGVLRDWERNAAR